METICNMWRFESIFQNISQSELYKYTYRIVS